MLASLGVSEDDQDMKLPAEETLMEPAIGRANALLPSLHKLSHLVSNIVTGFRPFLE
jgi:hypothetical protein